MGRQSEQEECHPLGARFRPTFERQHLFANELELPGIHAIVEGGGLATGFKRHSSRRCDERYQLPYRTRPRRPWSN